MIEIFGAAALFGFFLALVAACALTALGVRVVKKYPDRLDPERSAKRYTRPAGVLVMLVVLGVLMLVVGLIGLGLTLIAT